MIEQMPNNTDRDFGDGDTTFMWGFETNPEYSAAHHSVKLIGFHLKLINVNE